MEDAAWLAELPSRIERCLARWTLELDEPLEGGSVGRVFGCRDGHGRDLVLKLSPPLTNAAEEARALEHWAGRGAPRLVAWDGAANALLMERVRPGTYLLERDRSSTRLPGSDARAVQAAAGALKQIQTAPSPAVGVFPSFGERLDWWLEYMARYSEPDAVGTPMLPRFERLARSLDTSAKHKTLVHGDFVAKNLLLNSDGSYVAVDPIPFFGDPASDIGQFTAYHSPVATVIPRARAIAEAAGMDAERAAAWAALWMVTQATETWREDSDEIQAWVLTDECQAPLAG